MTPETASPCVLVGTDGSPQSIHAVRTALPVLATPARIVVATVVPPVDPMMVSGTGLAGGVASPQQYDETVAAETAAAEATIARTADALAGHPVETRVVWGDAGRGLCELAEELPATVIVVGTRGLGGVKRFFLGSVSRYVVQHAPCPVIVVPDRDVGS